MFGEFTVKWYIRMNGQEIESCKVYTFGWDMESGGLI